MKSEDALYDEAYLFVVEQQKASTIIVDNANLELVIIEHLG